MSVYFHANFGLNRANMAEILKAALKDPSKRDKELAAPFGLGPAFTARTRSWLHKTGLAEQGFPVSLTEEGKEIWEKDPKLSSIVTQWFLHYKLTTDPQRAEVWHYFIHEFFPANPTLNPNISFLFHDLLCFWIIDLMHRKCTMSIAPKSMSSL